MRLMFRIIILIFCEIFIQIITCDDTIGIKLCLKSTRVEVIARNNPLYTTLNDNYEIRVIVEPKGFLVPSDVKDVKQIIRCARLKKLKIITKSGGHSYEKFSYGTNRHWVIDMRKFKSITVDKENAVAKVGAGITLEELVQTLVSEGFILPFGICYTVGVTGFTLGGGDGVIVRYTGFMVQRVKQVNIVTANSRSLKANDKTHKDLFFALRGAGAQSYGVVTQFMYNLIQLPTTITVNKVFDNPNVFEILKSWISWAESNAKNEANSILWLNWPKTGQVNLYATIIRGDENEELALKADIKNRFTNVHDEDFSVKSFNESYRSIGYYVPKLYFKSVDFYVDRVFNDEEKNIFCAASQKLVVDCPYCIIYFKMFGGKAKENRDNAFVHSSVLYGVSAYVNVEVEGIGEQRAREIGSSMLHHLNSFLYATKDLDSGQTYQNYVDKNRTDWRKRYFGNVYPKLVNIKRRYDRINLFNCPQCVSF